MANHESAKKRARQTVKRNVLNRTRRSIVHTLTKEAEHIAASGDAEKATAAARKVEAALAKSAAKGTLHKKAAARKTSRLVKRIKKAVKA
ncbi:MAG: 30S ribosomal protein S20 [Alphaproteobacteria bacterium]|nr:30S ribosomal protein S20 [Alphaproteobacteria bacterium]